MNDLEQWGRRAGSLLPSREERAQSREIEGVTHVARVSALRVDALAAVTARILDRAAALDAQRVALAGGNPDLNAVLARIELGFVDGVGALQRDAAGQGFRL